MSKVGLEIKRKIDENNKLIESLVTPNIFTLNNTVAELLKENEKIEITTSTGRKEVVETGKPQGRGAAGKKVIYLKANETITEVHSV